jgi:hypothetical protein
MIVTNIDEHYSNPTVAAFVVLGRTIASFAVLGRTVSSFSSPAPATLGYLASREDPR